MTEIPGLIVGSPDGSVRALRVTDGKLLWQRRLAHASSDIVLARAGSLLLAMTADRVVHVLRLRDGVKVWGMRPPPYESEPQGPAHRLARLYVRMMATTQYVVIQDRRQILFVESWSGRLLWRYLSAAQTTQLIGFGPTRLFVFEQNTESEDPRLTPRSQPPTPPRRTTTTETLALSLQDGATIWTTRDYAARESESHGPTSLAVSGSLAFSFGERGLYALSESTGDLVWAQAVDIRFPLGKLALAAGHVAIWANQDLLVFCQRDGEPAWSLAARGDGPEMEMFGAVVAMGDIISIGTRSLKPDSSRIEARDSATGEITWTWPISSQEESGDTMWRLCGADGMLYLPGQSDLVALRASDGQPQWAAHDPLGFGALLPIVAADAR
jgi:outer membrane protein assembly factor BamB